MPGSLPELQDWFLTVMTAAGGIGRGVALAADRYGRALDDVVAHSHGPSAETRMRIYADGYLLRLIECLRADYPMLLQVMGDPLFTFFAKTYIWRHPSGSPSLYDLGAGFPDFLASSQTEKQGGDALMLLPLEIARLERARTEAGRAHGLERHGAEQPSILHPLAVMLGQDVILSAPPCLRLLELSLLLLPYVDSFGHGDNAAPAPQPNFVAVTRIQYRVGAHQLEDWQFRLLQLLVELRGQSTSLRHCAESVARHTARSVDHVMVQIALWVPEATTTGLVLAEMSEL